MVEIVLPTKAQVSRMYDREVHPRLILRLLDLEFYNIKWVHGTNVWSEQLATLDLCGAREAKDGVPLEPPAIAHENVTISCPASWQSTSMCKPGYCLV